MSLRERERGRRRGEANKCARDIITIKPSVIAGILVSGVWFARCGTDSNSEFIQRPEPFTRSPT